MSELWGAPGRWNVRKSYVGIARRLGVDEETVRNRLKRMKESGFLIGWRLVPNPALLRRTYAMRLLSFRSAATKERAISELRRAEGVVVVTSLYGSDLLVTLFDDADGASSKRLAALGARRGPLEMRGMGFPSTEFKMTPTDWQIMSSMLRNAERSVAEVAALVKVSVRTVKRRLDKMMANSALFIMPIVDQTKSTGISYQLVVQSREGRKPEVDKLVTSKLQSLVFKASDSSDSMIFGFFGRNISEGRELLDWIENKSAVKSARINIVEQVNHEFDWLERETKCFAG
jgi:DNA-binding Lrp family transcriptional regulator